MYKYITPWSLGTLKRNEVIVFGCQEYGIQGEGPSGQSYAIPIIGRKVTAKTLKRTIERFTEYASEHQELVFYVTEIGRGTRKFPPYKIAIMFFEASGLPNVYLPRLYWDELEFWVEFEASL